MESDGRSGQSDRGVRRGIYRTRWTQSESLEEELQKAQETIITADPGDLLLVMAGPGTGKTYCVIEKLKYLVENKLVDAQGILLLCYTRAAVKEVRDRLFDEIQKHPELSDSFSRVDIRTFDSFATRVLISRDIEFSGKDYDDRILMCIKEIEKDPSILTDMHHFIVDEIQDLVGLRALMVKTIIDKRPGTCGFTLLGDHIQGIYDYQIKDQPDAMDSRELIDWIRETGTGGFYEVVLNFNRRQTIKLARSTGSLRSLLVRNDEHGALNFLSRIEAIDSCGYDYNFLVLVDGRSTTAVLCRTNGEALRISTLLRKRRIDHTIRIQRDVPLTPYWVCDLPEEESISRDAFTRFCEERMLAEPAESQALFDYIKVISGDDAGRTFRRSKLVAALNKGARLPDEYYEPPKTQITVSTIHRVKGREFDKVLLLEPKAWSFNKDPEEEAKVYYVGITRARNQLFTIEHSRRNKWLRRRDDLSSRWIETGFGDKEGRLYGFQIGVDGDVDEIGFVNSSLFDDPYETQTTIKEVVRPGDPLLISLLEDQEVYGIFHNRRLIGKMSPRFTRHIKAVTWGLPLWFEDVYVESVYSVHRKPETLDDTVPTEFLDTGIWYGISVVGLGNPRWPTDTLI